MWEREIEEIQKRKKLAYQLGGEQNSFMEMGLFAHSDRPGMEDVTPADGLICGYGIIDGRRVAVIANDFTVLASTNAKVNLKKVLQFKAQVKDRIRVPLIRLQANTICRILLTRGEPGTI